MNTKTENERSVAGAIRSRLRLRAATLLALAAILAAPPGTACAFEATVEVATGYDDNADLSPQPRGSGFWIGAAKGSQSFVPAGGGFSAGVYFEGRVQDYFRFGDRFAATAGASATMEAADGLVSGSLFLEAATFRDELVPEDDLDGITAGIAAGWFPTSESEILFRQAFSANDYRKRETVARFSQYGGGPGDPGSPGGPGGGQGPPQGPGTGPPPGNNGPPPPPLVFSEEPRDDRVSITDLSWIGYLGPSTTVQITGEHIRNSSSIEGESYDSNGLHLSLTWFAAQEWELSFALSVWKSDFDVDPIGRTRSDKVRSAGFQLTRHFGDAKLYARFDQTDADSSFRDESYQQTVTQCGFSWSF